MREYGKVSPQFWMYGGVPASAAPATWTDHDGTVRATPHVLGRLRSTCPGHAALKAYVIRRDGACVACGRTDRLETDHILSRRRGGAHHPVNLQALCGGCNATKACVIEGAGRTREAA